MNYYTTEKAVQVLISLLKQHGISKIIASPGSTNMGFVASLQRDPYFEMFSAVDERSAAYMACGLAAESGEPVVISCTGATASRNYMPGQTEAYYRKLPILAVTGTQAVSKVGHHVAQVIDRSVMPNDVATLSVNLPIVKDSDDIWECEIKTNQAILALKRHGGGPVHLNLPTTYSHDYSVKELPQYRKMERITTRDCFPDLPSGTIAVFIGSHLRWDQVSTDLLDQFCKSNNAVVICDHTSGYYGKYRVQYALAGCQNAFDGNVNQPELSIHIGEVTGDYYGSRLGGKRVWRVSLDGELRDTFRKLTHVFEMSESEFFAHYSKEVSNTQCDYFESCSQEVQQLRSQIPDVPFSNIWLASQMAHRIPQHSVVHFGILNSLRAWNFYDLPKTVTAASNVGGFGIDGGLSSVVGASFANRDKLYYCVIGDLAFFYDMNIIGNRHLGNNLRILLVNNGKGTEFRQYGKVSDRFGEELDRFVAAAGHFGNKSKSLVKHYAEDFGFEYITASNKMEFSQSYERILTPEITDKPILFEVFTESDEETKALELIMGIKKESKHTAAKQLAKSMLGDKSVRLIKKIVK